MSFWRHVKKTGSCWEWQGACTRDGYGRWYFPGEGRKSTHRWSWLHHAGIRALPRHLYVCHHCDNKRCVNPEHLFVGTHRDNTKDMIRKQRRFQAYTPKLSPAEAQSARSVWREYGNYVLGKVPRGIDSRAMAEVFGLTQTGMRSLLAYRNKNVETYKAKLRKLLEDEGK